MNATIALEAGTNHVGYESSISQQFMSLESNAGNCESVQSPVTGEFLADANGNWQSNPDFDYTLAIYSFDFQAFSTSLTEYVMAMQNLQSLMNELGRVAMTQNLIGNLMLWMSFSKNFGSEFTEATGSLLFTLTGSPNYVFNRAYQVGTFANVHGTCTASSFAQFSKAESMLVCSFSHV